MKSNPSSTTSGDGAQFVSKVAHVTLAFWVVKILATTVGETGGDALSMSLKLGYALSTLIFVAFFAVALTTQVTAKRYHALFYWAVVVATTTVGTTTSDYFDRTLGLGYVKSSIVELCIVIAVLLTWRLASGRISFDRITSRKDETFYWLAILVANTLGTALGDFLATSAGLGFERGAVVFGALIALVAALYFFRALPTSVLFWSAYILTRPLGATLGDTLTKSHHLGGLGFDRISSSLIIVAGMVVVVSLTPLRRSSAIAFRARPAVEST